MLILTAQRYGSPSSPGPGTVQTLYKQLGGSALNGFAQYASSSNGGAANNAYNAGNLLLPASLPMIESSLTPGILVQGGGGIASQLLGAHAYHDVAQLDPTSMDYTVSAQFASQASELWLDFECAGTSTDDRGYAALLNLGGFYAGIYDQVQAVSLGQSAGGSIPATFSTPNGGTPVYYQLKVVVHHSPRTADVWARLVGGSWTQYLSAVALRAASASSRKVGIGLEWLAGVHPDQWAGGLLTVTTP